MADHRGNREWKWICIGILKGKNGSITQWLAIINETVIVAKTLEDCWVDKYRGTELATGNMDVRNTAPIHTCIHDLNCVCGYSIWKWCRWSLAYSNRRLAALATLAINPSFFVKTCWCNNYIKGINKLSINI